MKPASRFLSTTHRTNAPPPARALTISRTFFGKVEIRLDAAWLKSVTSSLHSPLDEGTAIPASQPTAGTPFSLAARQVEQKLHRHAWTCSGHPRLTCRTQDVDGIGPRACPRSAPLSDASRVNSTCVDKPGHDVEPSSTLLRFHGLQQRCRGLPRISRAKRRASIRATVQGVARVERSETRDAINPSFLLQRSARDLADAQRRLLRVRRRGQPPACVDVRFAGATRAVSRSGRQLQKKSPGSCVGRG